MANDIRTFLTARRAEVVASIAREEKKIEGALRQIKLSWDKIRILNIRLDEINREMKALRIADVQDNVIRVAQNKTGSGLESRAHARPTLHHRFSAARGLSLTAVMRMSEDEARDAFARIRWHEHNGKPICGRCGCIELYACKTEHRWKCKRCGYRFSVTSGTIFASHKLPIRDVLAAIAIWVNAEEGYSALQFSRDLDVQYRAAFYLSRKIREAI
jgi:transposase-like protein